MNRKCELKDGDIIKVPDGCKATVDGDSIIIQKLNDFKKGDVLKSYCSDLMVIFDYYEVGSDKQVFKSCCANKRLDWNILESQYYRHQANEYRRATERETAIFFNELEKRGLFWNPETKEVENNIRRAKDGYPYIYIDIVNGEVVLALAIEQFSEVDATRYRSGNYYKLEDREFAERTVSVIRSMFVDNIDRLTKKTEHKGFSMR